MMTLSLFLLLPIGCEITPTEEQLVRECQNRNGTPDIRGAFQCEMSQEQKRLSQYAPPPVRHD